MRPLICVFLFVLLFLVAVPLSAARTKPSASTADNLNGVVILASNNGWTVGNEGTTEHFDGSSWSLVASGTGSDLLGVSFGPPGSPNADSGFAVGGSGGAAVALYRSPVSWELAMAGLSGPDCAETWRSLFD